MNTSQKQREQLDRLTTEGLGIRYVNCFIASKKDPNEKMRLEDITVVLSQRPFDEVKFTYHAICREMESCSLKENYERAALFKEMRDHFFYYILD